MCATKLLHESTFPTEDPGRQAARTPEGLDAQAAMEEVITAAQMSAFELDVPSARVVRIRNADHHVFRSNEGLPMRVFQSNEADVLREMNAFIAGLK